MVNSDVSLMITNFPFVESRRVFDKNLGLHDAFVIFDNYIFVQVRTYEHLIDNVHSL